jgi:hypothetical protein
LIPREHGWRVSQRALSERWRGADGTLSRRVRGDLRGPFGRTDGRRRRHSPPCFSGGIAHCPGRDGSQTALRWRYIRRSHRHGTAARKDAPAHQDAVWSRPRGKIGRFGTAGVSPGHGVDRGISGRYGVRVPSSHRNPTPGDCPCTSWPPARLSNDVFEIRGPGILGTARGTTLLLTAPIQRSDQPRAGQYQLGRGNVPGY